MSHVTHINASCHTCQCVVAHIRQGICGWYAEGVLELHVMAHIRMSHVTHMNESCHTYGWVMSHISMRRGTHINISWHIFDGEFVDGMLMEFPDRMSWHTHKNESCHTYEWVMSHKSMRHVTHISASCHTHQCVMSHTSMHHVTHINASCHTYQCVVAHISQGIREWHLMQSLHLISWSGVATISRLLKIIGLFCRISSLLKGSFAKETYNYQEPTSGSHPVYIRMSHVTRMTASCVSLMTASCQTYEWVISPVNSSWHTYKSVMSHTWTRRAHVDRAIVDGMLMESSDLLSQTHPGKLCVIDWLWLLYWLVNARAMCAKPHEPLLGIQRVSTPSSENKRISKRVSTPSSENNGSLKWVKMRNAH